MNVNISCTFTDMTIRLDHNHYEDCTFNNCVIEYGGEGPIGLVRCTFNKCGWKLVGSAMNTVMFLKTMYHSLGGFGQTMVEQTFNSIRGDKSESGSAT